eukprot:Hpha_TRINITY_DN16230_c1_g1::TRINITY_DN16230_c1_g1_i1::g.11431::m.11431
MEAGMSLAVSAEPADSPFLKSPISAPAADASSRGTGPGLRNDSETPPSPDISLSGAGGAPGEAQGLSELRKKLAKKEAMAKATRRTPKTPLGETPEKEKKESEETESFSEYSTDDSDEDFVGQPPSWTAQYGYQYSSTFQPTCAVILGSKKKAHQRAKAKRLARKLTDGSQWECEQCSNTNLVTSPSCSACEYLDLDMLEVGEHVVKRVREEQAAKAAERRKQEEKRRQEREKRDAEQRAKQQALRSELEKIRKALAEKEKEKAARKTVPATGTPGKEENVAAAAPPLPPQDPAPKPPPATQAARPLGKEEGRASASPPPVQERRETPAAASAPTKEGERRRRRDRDEEETRRARKERRLERREGERRMKKDKRRELENDSVSSTEAVPVPSPDREPRSDDRRRRRERRDLDGKDSFQELRHLSQMISATLKGQVEGVSETRRRRKKMDIDESDTADAVSARRRDRKRPVSRSESPQPPGKRRREQASGAAVPKREEKRGKSSKEKRGVDDVGATPESARSRRKEERRQRLLAVVHGCEEIRPEAAKPGVNKGVVHYIATGAGTHRWVNPYTEGLINASASSVGQGDVSHALNYRWDSSCRFATAEASEQAPGAGSKPSYVAFDFTDYEVLPTHYSISHAADLPRAFLRSWSLRGSGDNYRWDILSKHTNDDTINEACTSAQFRISIPESPKFYRYFMIRLEPQGSSSATNQLVSNCFELYGYVRRREKDSSRP